VLAVAFVLFSATTALASGLTLVSIPGPSGTPFKSPGGFGPTFVASPPGDTRRVFVGTQDGYIYVIDNGVLQPTPFLDLHAKVSTYAEDGMFSMVFDPNYATNRRFYVDYSDKVDTSATPILDNYHLDEFQTSATNPDLADPSTQTQILEVPTTGCTLASGAHYGGQLQFGPDGHLWVAIGDGSDGCNDDYNAMNLDSLHGKLLRIIPQPTQAPDANGNRYSIPADNPLVGQSGVDPEIWAYGLRNPYRFSFDPTNGDVIIGDVGNSTQEEIDRVPSTLAAGAPPPFFGWPCFEGSYVTPSISPCPVTQTPVAPVITFAHGSASCTAIIGGYVLEDPSLGGDYDGRYLYGYWCANGLPGLSGELLTTDLSAATPVTRDEGIGVGFGLSSFGEDACGHPYVTNVSAGGLWRIEGPTPGPCGEFTGSPAITGISPSSGPPAGGTSVTVTGSGFTGATRVAFGAVAATSLNVVSDTQITAVSPAQAAGAHHIVVTAPGGTSALVSADVYTYTAPAPAITGISPSSGPPAGGTSVTITGSGFTGATRVGFGAVSATSFTVVSDTKITAVSPAQTGAHYITVTTTGGTSATSAAAIYTYKPPAPVITGISPSSGPPAGGTSVTITGSGFTGATRVAFGGVAATSFSVVSDTQITAVSPAQAAGAHHIVVTGPGGTSALVSADVYSYKPPAPAITAISPSSGPPAGGTSVTITGSGFTAATRVAFGGVAATSFNVVSDTQITAVSPAQTGAHYIVVTAPGGTSATVSAAVYTYH
jgi:glucose/arabinose dehydrogenase